MTRALSDRQSQRLLPFLLALGLAGGVAGASGTGAAHAAATGARIATSARCYAVGKAVTLKGSGFTASSPYDVAVDGVDFGRSTTNSSGAFKTSFYPGGLGAGQAQIVDRLDVSDGSSDPAVNFTVTRATGALFGTSTSTSTRRKVPFEVWDFAPTGPEVPVYLHYVRGGGISPKTIDLGTTTGQCGYLRTSPLKLFPFTPTKGLWLLQFDSDPKYVAKPKGHVARLIIQIG